MLVMSLLHKRATNTSLLMVSMQILYDGRPTGLRIMSFTNLLGMYEQFVSSLCNVF